MNSNECSRYSEALLALTAELVNRVQFRTNRSQLQKLDDTSVDDDDETEWQQYLRVCIETVMKVRIEIEPNYIK